MSRIRTIKPEFWTSEQVVECSPIARLLFIGMWNFADDGGNLPANPRTLKMLILPGDEDIRSIDISSLVEELIVAGLVAQYIDNDKVYWHVTGWHHQKIDRPSFKYPAYDKSKVQDHSSNIRRAFDEQSLREGKGEEGKGMDNITISDEIVSSASCDADPEPDPKISRCKREGVASSAILEIGSSWNSLASSVGLPQIDTIDGDRKRSVDARARELAANYEFHDPVAGFAFLFAKVRGSPFLCGQVQSRDGRPAFRATFDWCVSPKNFRKIMEGNYENQVVKPFPLLARA